jgi:hypothetical protein
MSEISDLADSIFASEFDSDPDAVNLSLLNGWLQENLGLLNTLINTSYNGENPGMGLKEKAIYKQIYLYNYYGKQTRNVLRGIVSVTSSDNILMVADGDNRIQFANKNEISKTFRDMARDSKQALDMMVAKYNIYAAKPLQVGGIEAGREDIVEDLPAIVENAQNLLIAGILDGGLDNPV